jgi:hypothetical protein
MALPDEWRGWRPPTIFGTLQRESAIVTQTSEAPFTPHYGGEQGPMNTKEAA